VGGRVKENDGDDFKIYYKHFCKYHNVPPTQQYNKNKIKFKEKKETNFLNKPIPHLFYTMRWQEITTGDTTSKCLRRMVF
jgi:hypothetical protein